TGLALVRPEHQVFYRRICMYETIAEPRPFPNVSKKTALMASDFRNVREKILTRFPIMRSSAFERRMLFDRTDLRQAMPRPTLVPARERVSGGRA
ncbi:MAG: hypothetical protein JO052_14975, partial [Bradyrhizobium sp.]|nr:hypothetical protein [Bradyrhizobium sp.]